jgi:hypothetical protein
MIVWTPSGFLSLDEMFSRVGLEMFGSQWTGNELLAGWALPPEYWRDQELSRKADALDRARERKGHSERAQKAAVSISGSPMGRSSSNSMHRLGKTPTRLIQDPDWRCETYVREYLEDKEAVARYQHVAKRIIESCWYGEYLIFESGPSGHFLPIDKTTIQGDAFQGIISDPWAPNRDRLKFISREDAAASTALVDSTAPGDAADQLKPAGDPKIDEAISAVYETAKGKPPNLNELVAPVKDKLREQGLSASKERIQKIAGNPKHSSRRGKSGVTVRKR